ncbi:hypothetical protein J4Q44_G00028170 [Coregonus suidteri]|uniref:Uncharacterized protein n=1 Tax=Coregonus suidteri TaxID=861788 RepID=A0AAN8RGT7_9TELE
MNMNVPTEDGSVFDSDQEADRPITALRARHARQSPTSTEQEVEEHESRKALPCTAVKPGSVSDPAKHQSPHATTLRTTAPNPKDQSPTLTETRDRGESLPNLEKRPTKTLFLYEELNSK